MTQRLRGGGLALLAAALLSAGSPHALGEACLSRGEWRAPGGSATRALTAGEVLARAKDARFVLLGEEHDNPDHHRWQLHSLAMLLGAPAQAAAQTQPAPFRAGDPKLGKALVERDCVSCHAKLYPADPDQIYRRADRRVKSAAQLLARVQTCNAQLGKSYFPEDEEYVAAYLNLEFYHFKP